MENNVLELANGAIKENVMLECKKVFENIMDPNTKATAKRTVTIKLTFEPDDKRQNIVVTAQADSKLCPINAIQTSMYANKNYKTGGIEAIECRPQIPGQQALDTTTEPEATCIKFA